MVATTPVRVQRVHWDLTLCELSENVLKVASAVWEWVPSTVRNRVRINHLIAFLDFVSGGYLTLRCFLRSVMYLCRYF